MAPCDERDEQHDRDKEDQVEVVVHRAGQAAEPGQELLQTEVREEQAGGDRGVAVLVDCSCVQIGRNAEALVDAEAKLVHVREVVERTGAIVVEGSVPVELGGDGLVL